MYVNIHKNLITYSPWDQQIKSTLFNQDMCSVIAKNENNKAKPETCLQAC